MNFKFRMVLSICFVIFLVCTTSARGGPNQSGDEVLVTISSMDAPDADVSGMAWDGLSLWAVGAETGIVYRQIADEEWEEVFFVEKGKKARACGIEFVNGYVWIATSDGRVYKYSLQGDYIDIKKFPVRASAGLVWIPNRIWCTEPSERRLMSLIPAGSRIKTDRALKPMGANPGGIAWDGKHVWITDTSKKALSKVFTDTNTVLSTHRLPCDRPGALAFDGKRFWIADRSDGRIKAFRHPTRKGKSPKPATSAGEAEGTTHPGSSGSPSLVGTSWAVEKTRVTDRNTIGVGGTLATNDTPAAGEAKAAAAPDSSASGTPAATVGQGAHRHRISGNLAVDGVLNESAEIVVIDQGNGMALRRTRPDRDGRFELQGLAPGTYELAVVVEVPEC